MKKPLRNHKLINYLADHRLVSMVSVTKTHVIATLSPRFTPNDVPPLCDDIGQWPMPRKKNGQYFVIFERFPNFEVKPTANPGEEC